MPAYLLIRRTSSTVKTRQPFLSRGTSATRPASSHLLRVMGATPTILATCANLYVVKFMPVSTRRKGRIEPYHNTRRGAVNSILAISRKFREGILGPHP